MRPRGAARLDLLFSAILGAVFFLFLQTSSSIPGGDDAYRHVRFANRLITDTRAALADPWRLPFFWPKPLDVWFGYHVLLSPWTLILPLIQAVKLWGAVLWAGSVYAILRLLDSMGAVWRYAWVILAVAGSGVVLYRATLVRPFLISLFLFALATRYVIEERPVPLALVSALHALSYSIFFLPALPAGLYLLIERSRRSVVLAACCTAGLFVGLAVSPFFPENLKFSVTLALTRLGHDAAQTLDIGGELRPMNPWWLAASIPVMVAWLAAIAVYWRERKSRPQLVLLAMSLVSLAMSFRAARMFDFFVPVAVVFAASVLSARLPQHREKAAYAFGFLFLICAANLVPAYATVKKAPSVFRYQGVSEFVLSHDADAMVFNTHWEQYPFLYFWNWRSRYITGMDPTFLYFTDARRYWLWRHVSDDAPDKDVADVAHEFGARYILVDRSLNPKLTGLLRGRMPEVYQDSAISLFEPVR